MLALERRDSVIVNRTPQMQNADRAICAVGVLKELCSSKVWCPEEDSNFHTLRYTDLNRARLPIPPSGQAVV
jgi:hypothetical protein